MEHLRFHCCFAGDPLALRGCSAYPSHHLSHARIYHSIVLISDILKVMQFNGAFMAVLRLLRLLKLVGKIDALKVIMKGLATGMASVGNILLLLGLVVSGPWPPRLVHAI